MYVYLSHYFLRWCNWSTPTCVRSLTLWRVWLLCCDRKLSIGHILFCLTCKGCHFVCWTIDFVSSMLRNLANASSWYEIYRNASVTWLLKTYAELCKGWCSIVSRDPEWTKLVQRAPIIVPNGIYCHRKIILKSRSHHFYSKFDAAKAWPLSCICCKTALMKASSIYLMTTVKPLVQVAPNPKV